MGPLALADYIKNLAIEAGFDLCRIARADAVPRGDYLQRWLDTGRAGSMQYLHRNTEIRMNPANLLDGARSVIVTAMVYNSPKPTPAGAGDSSGSTGRVARYAWGDDYHRVIKKKLFSIADQLREVAGSDHRFRACVDTAPLLERELAAAAGIGWIGKNTLALHADIGSYFFLGEIVTTLALPADDPVVDRCGTCTACLDACPTEAFPKPYEMDASRCISYLTIEHRGPIPEELGTKTQDWIFGCDICQEVCPYNRHAPTTQEPRFAPRPTIPQLNLLEVLDWSEDDYRTQLRGSAMKRAKLPMLKRNAKLALANTQHAPRAR